MFIWKKLGKIFTPQDVRNKSWMKEYAQAPSVLVYKNFIRIYFSCRPYPDRDSQYISYSAFIDVNRHNPAEVVHIAEKPILPLGGRGTFDEFGTYPVSVIRMGRKIYAYYGGWTRCVSVPFNVAIGMAISDDNGVTFKRSGSGPVLSYSPDEPFIISGPKIRRFHNTWYVWYIAGKKWIRDNGKPEPVYRIRMATSKDGQNWEKYGKDIIQTTLGGDEAQASPDVIWYKNSYHMFFCYRYSTDFRGKRGYRIGYAKSEDLFHWQRDDTGAGITVSSKGWDDESVSYPHVFESDGTLYMLYLGNQVGKYGFGLARLDENSDVKGNV